jgi:alkylation response protein AidB-like acyl-CoA dehydrogenase
MLRTDSAPQARFRAELREWLEANLPAELQHLSYRPSPQEVMPWFKKLSQRGLLAPHWPRAEGGMDATPVEQVIIVEELVRVGAPDLPMQGVNHIGPLLIKRGNEAQKRKHLPKIMSGEVIWAQGYSEPDTGSDLASLRCKAVVDGDYLVVNGQKTWNAWAQQADWVFALVRTGGGKSRRDGITFILADIKTPGITCRPIRTLSGDEELCEIFFVDVRVSIENVVGEIGDGWSVANSLLAEERIRSGSPTLALRALSRLKAVARLTGADKDPWMIDRIAGADIEVMVLESTYIDALERLQAGESNAGDASCLKIMGTETTQHVLEVLQEAAGPLAAVKTPDRVDEAHPDYSQNFLQSRRLSIYGGSNEIQRSILAMRVLGLPRGRDS